MNPLCEDLSKLKDTELENKIQELSKKYFQTHNLNLQHQISVFLDLYRAELENRRARLWQEQYQKRDKDLDSLINVN
jgi:tryptophanase